jgi:hypothetical protein
MTSTKSSLYPSGAVFTVDLEANDLPKTKAVHAGRVDRPPNDPSFDVAVIEFEDDGTYIDQSQVMAAAACIEQARRSNENGALVIIFIHGWHHGASWDIENDEGDAHFRNFRQILTSFALREAERYTGGPAGRRVVGVFFGWNGDPLASWLHNTSWLTHLSFWNRYRTARKVGSGRQIREAVSTIVASTKRPIERHCHSDGQRAESPLILIGHSMGALMLQSAFLSLLRAKSQPLVQERSSQLMDCVEIRRGDEVVSFPDILLAINSAAHSRIAKNIIATLRNQRITKTLTAVDIRYSPPLFISFTSTADCDTKRIWRWAQLGRFWRKTDGHDQSLFTHAFRTNGLCVSCPRREMLDFGQNWHCLRPPIPLQSPTPSFSIDLPVRERTGRQDVPDFVRYELATLRNDHERPHLAWIFQVPREVVANHNDIFNSRCRELIIGLIQISGAVMNLAEDRRRNFEDF